MSEAKTKPADYEWRAPHTPTIHVLKENKRPVGFAEWPEPQPVIESPKKRWWKR